MDTSLGQIKKVTLTNGTELIVPSVDVLKSYVKLTLEEKSIDELIENADCYLDILVALAAQQLKNEKPIIFERDGTLVPGYPVTLTTLAKLVYDDRENMSDATKSSLTQPIQANDIP